MKWWRSLRVGHRAMIASFGGVAVWIGVGLLDTMLSITLPMWLYLLAVACGVAGLLYAYTRRCPNCGAGGVIHHMAPQRQCEECGTMFLNDRFF